MHLPPIAPTLPQLPPGSALRFQSEQADPRPSRSRALMNNVEHQMTHLLGWAGGDAAALRRTRVEPTVSAHERREEVRTFLRGRADVHQKRARRRELPEPSGTMRLPREAARMRPRQGMEREVSYLSDRKTRNHRDVNDVRDIPDSLIPDTFRISLEAPLPMSHGLFAPDSAMANAWELNPGTRKWELPIFPSKLPAGRRDVVLLHSWVNDMLMRLKQSSNALNEDELLKEAQLLFCVAFHEIIRQASVHCLERGHLMGKIWWSEMELFQRLMGLRRADEERHQAELGRMRDEQAARAAEHAEQAAALHKRIATLEALCDKNGVAY